VPIRVAGTVVGVLDVQSPEPDAFGRDDVVVIETLANQLAVAIENAQLVSGLEAQVAARTAEMRAEKEKSDAILRSVGDAIAMANLDEQIEYVNQAFTELTGYAAHEILGKGPNFLLSNALTDPANEGLQRAMATGEVWRGEASLRRRDGRTYDAAVIVAPVHDADGELVGFVSSHRDVSRVKELERARSGFITNVSHQFRTPLTTIQLYLHLLKNQCGQGECARPLQTIEQQVERLIHLLEDILEVAGLDSGGALQRWEPVSLPTLIDTAIGAFHDEAADKELRLEVAPLPPDLPTLNGDQRLLGRAVAELLQNAILFTPGGGRVMLEVQRLEGEVERWVTIAVSDDGPGIAEEERERVFERFFRGRLAEAGNIPGTGLGLSIAQAIAHAHGGQVTLESAEPPRQGTRFQLWLRPEGRG
jgi:PAS domain S-box-containing protein